MTFLVEARDISKHFSGARALEGVSVTFRGGEVHALVGENGAGKSTLSKIVAGVQLPDDGQVLVEGEQVHLASAAAANARGITMVHQELSVIGSLSVAENVLIGIEPTRRGFIARRELASGARRYLQAVGLDVDPDRPASGLPAAQQQLVEIARALAMDSALVIFDEPTSSLGHEDAARLLRLVRDLRDEGRAIVLVSHNLKEVLTTADRITVLRDGRLVASDETAAFDEESLIRHMVGRDVHRLEQRAQVSADAGEALVVEGLVAPGVKGVSFSVAPGEILGIAGLVGSGRSETLAAIYGARRRHAGKVLLFDAPFDPRTPTDALASGVGLVPESRKDQGLHLGLSVAHNIELASLDRFSPGGWISRKQGAQLVDRYRNRLRIKSSGPGDPVASLSGGNQQKVVLAKILATQPRVLLLDEPTRGIDVGAKDEVNRLVRELADGGMAIVVVSSVIEELLLSCDRIVVLHDGRSVGQLPAATATEEDVLRLAFQGAGA